MGLDDDNYLGTEYTGNPGACGDREDWNRLVNDIDYERKKEQENSSSTDKESELASCLIGTIAAIGFFVPYIYVMSTIGQHVYNYYSK